MLSAFISIAARIVKEPGGKVLANGSEMAWSTAVCELQCKDAKDGKVGQFFNVLAFGNAAELLGKLSKGETVNIHGQLQATQYTKDDGTDVQGLSIVADSILCRYGQSANDRKPPGKPPQKNTTPPADLKPDYW